MSQYVKWTNNLLTDIKLAYVRVDFSPEGRLRWYYWWTQWGRTCTPSWPATGRNSPPGTPVKPGSWWMPWRSLLTWRTVVSCKSCCSHSCLHSILTLTLEHHPLRHQDRSPHTQIHSDPTPRLTQRRQRWGNTWVSWLPGRFWQNQEQKTSGRSVEASPPHSKTLVGDFQRREHIGSGGIGRSSGDRSSGRWCCKAGCTQGGYHSTEAHTWFSRYSCRFTWRKEEKWNELMVKRSALVFIHVTARR